MLRADRGPNSDTRQMHALVFAALGDETRLALVSKLSGGEAYSISRLTEEQSVGIKITRQAITKHLRVLERARIVRCERSGRERLFVLDPKPMLELKEYLEIVSGQWDAALGRLKSFVER
jgi:DNA-binding transcriptional ArsR family regulator